MITGDNNFWRIFKSTNGALSASEAIAIMNIAAQVPEGRYLELGTYKGKSALSAAAGLKQGWFGLVEPEFKDREWRDEVAIKVSLCADENNCNQKMVELFIETFADYSTNIIPRLETDFAYVFIDSGSHQDGLPMQEVKLLEDRMVQGGIIAFHDWKSQFIEVEEAYNYLLGTGKYEEIIIDWDEINRYVNDNNLNKGNLSWHHTELENPNFVGALRRK